MPSDPDPQWLAIIIIEMPLSLDRRPRLSVLSRGPFAAAWRFVRFLDGVVVVAPLRSQRDGASLRRSDVDWDAEGENVRDETVPAGFGEPVRAR